MRLCADDFHKFIYQSMKTGGKQWKEIRFFSDKTIESPIRGPLANPLIDPTGDLVRPESKAVFEKECFSLYESVFFDGQLEDACEKDMEFLASFHFGPEDDETCVVFHRTKDYSGESKLWIDIEFQRPTSVFSFVDEDGVEHKDEERYFESLEDTGIGENL